MQDLTGLEPELLGRALNKLERVNISGSKLAGPRLDPLIAQLDFTTLREVSRALENCSPARLKRKLVCAVQVNLDYLDCSEVGEEQLVSLYRGLHRLSMKKCGLGPGQVSSLLATLNNRTPSPPRLTHANLHGNR